MDVSRVTSAGKYSQYMGKKEICILIVNDDHTCRNIVADMLQHCSYEVLNFERATDALKAILESKDRLNLVLTNVHRTDANKFGIIQHLQKEFKLPIIWMSPDDNTKIISRGLGNGSGTTICFVKSLSMNDINNLWKDALARERGKMVAAELVDSSTAQIASIPENVAELAIGNTSSVEEASRRHQKRKKEELQETSEQNEASTDDSPMEKKMRFVWTVDMHQKFLEAIEQIGNEGAVPKKIVEVMNVPGLTRENVASHLQKYRMGLKKAGFASSFYGINLTKDVKEPYFSSGHSPISFNSSQGNSQQPHWRPSQQACRGSIAIPSSSCCHLINPEASTNSPKLGPLNSQRNLQFPYTGNVTSFDAASRKNTEHVNFGNMHHNDQVGLAHQESTTTPKVPVNQNFRVYGDQTKNILFTIENSRLSSNANQPSSSNTNSGYMGFRLASDGKSVEFGQTRVPGNEEIRRGKEFSAAESSVQYPSAFDNCLPLQDPSLPPLRTHGNESTDQYPSASLNCFPEQQSSLIPFRTNGNEGSDQYPSASINCFPDQQSSLIPFRTNGSEGSDQYPSASISCIPNQHSSLPPLRTNGNECSDQYHSMLSNRIHEQQYSMPQQQPFLPLLGTSGNESSVQHPSVSVNCSPLNETYLPPLPPLLHELDSFGTDADLDVLLHVTGSTSPQMLWDDDFDDILFKHAD